MGKQKSDNRISTNDLYEIRKLYPSMTEKELSAKYKISHYKIREIVNGFVPSGLFCIRKVTNELNKRDLF